MISDFFEKKKEILFHYSPFSFLHKADKKTILENTIQRDLLIGISDHQIETIEIELEGQKHLFLIKYLNWDSTYFKIPTYKLLHVLYLHDNYDILKRAVKEFMKQFFLEKNKYCFSEIPSEDIWVIQALNEIGFKLVETRLTYFLDVVNFKNERYGVRQGTLGDIPNLKRVAREMRNIYDRFHADSVYDVKIADEFLATYIEESLKGFADYVIVPYEDGVKPDAFLTANYLKRDWDNIGENVSKMVLSAVSAETCRGWYIKLISEMAFHLREIGANYAFMHPATTNKAVIHSYEKLGCKYGKCIHVFSYLS